MAQPSHAEPAPTPAEARAQYQKLDRETESEFDAGHAERAYQLAEEELAYCRRRLDPKGPEIDNAYGAVGVTAYATFRYARALEAVNASLALDDPSGNSTSDDVLHVRFVAATVLTLQQRFAEAEQQLRHILEREKQAGHESSEDFILAEMSLATNAAMTARFEDAQTLIGAALRGLQALKPANPQYEVLALQNRAQFSTMQGRYVDARAQFAEAIAQSAALDPQANVLDAAALATLFDNVALLDEIEGRFSEAEADFAKGAASLAPHPGALPTSEVQLANGLAMLHAFEGRPNVDAEIDRVLSAAQTLGPRTPLYATTLDNGGLLDMQQGRLDRARLRLQQALDIESAVYGQTFPDLVAPLLNLSQLAMYQGDLSGAQNEIGRAQSIVEKTPVQPGFAVGASLAAGRLAQLRGSFPQAEALTAQAEKLADTALGSGHPLLSGVHLQMGDIFFSQGVPAQATHAYEESFAVLFGEYVREFPTMTERDRLNFYAGADSLASHAFSFGVKYSRDPQVAGDTYDLALQQKNYVGTGIDALRVRIAAANDAGAAQTLDRLVELRSRIAALDYAAIDAGARRAQVADLEAQAKAAEDQFLARFPTNLQPAPVNWRDVQHALHPAEAAVEVFRYRTWTGVREDGTTRYAAAIVTPTASAPHVVALADAKVMEGPALASYRQRAGLTPYAAAPASTSLYDAFWKPLQAALDGAHRVYLAPSGVIAQIAPAAIELPDRRFVADAYDVRVVTSTRDLLRPKATFTNKTAELFGAPAFGGVQTAAGSQSAAGPSGSVNSNGDRARAIAGCGGALADLPESADEVKSITRALAAAGWTSRTHVGAEASKSALEALAAPRVLHLATHGIFIADAPDTGVSPLVAGAGPRPSVPDKEGAPGSAGGVEAGAPALFDARCHPHDPMFRSLLFFAGANRTWASGELPADGDDGILTASELAGLDLHHTELVVLSACDTGLGSGVAGEGVLGLRRALEQAGAQAVLMSMWPVPSAMTRDLMTAFYSHWLAGMDKHDALAAAQKDLRANEGARPSEWGAFVLVGT